MTLPDRFRRNEGADWPKDPPLDRAWLCVLWWLVGFAMGGIVVAYIAMKLV
tara:strand:- start:78 stop:230 length:153 start_codon:yes stop_codon:yes gene_type:complete